MAFTCSGWEDEMRWLRWTEWSSKDVLMCVVARNLSPALTLVEKVEGPSGTLLFLRGLQTRIFIATVMPSEAGAGKLHMLL
ncbi:unnamed protein product [Urochloa humidicola]